MGQDLESSAVGKKPGEVGGMPPESSPAFAKWQPLDQWRQAAVEARGGGQAENPNDHVDCRTGWQ